MIQPLGSRVVIKPDAPSETTSSGLYLPQTQEKPQEGTVTAVGPGDFDPGAQERRRVSVSVGQRVVYQKYAGTEYKYQDETYVIVLEKDILAVLRDE